MNITPLMRFVKVSKNSMKNLHGLGHRKSFNRHNHNDNDSNKYDDDNDEDKVDDYDEYD